MSFNPDELRAVHFTNHGPNMIPSYKYVYRNSAGDDVTQDGFFETSVLSIGDVIQTEDVELIVVEVVDQVKVNVKNKQFENTDSQRLDSGLIMKWGTASESGTVTFTEVFPNACVHVSITSIGNADGTSLDHRLMNESVSAESFDVTSAGSGDGVDAGFNWLALGY